MIHCRSEILTSLCTPRALEDYNGIHRTVAVTFRRRLRENASRRSCTRGVHTRCPPRVRRRAENCIMQAGENVARRVFIFRRRRRHVSFTSRARRICKDRRRTRSFSAIPARRDSSSSTPSTLSSLLSVVASHIFRTPRKYRIASARILTYVYAENWKYRAVYYREG